jgi:hypothetical protein
MEAKINQDIKNTVAFWVILDCILELLTSYTLTTSDYALQITDTHRLVFSVYYSLQ